jgi:hypothetical protein
LLRKAVHSWMQNVSLRTKRLKRRCESGWDNSQKTLCACFDALVKRWDRCINVGGGYVEKLLFCPGSNIACFAFYIHLWPIYWLFLLIPRAIFGLDTCFCRPIALLLHFTSSAFEKQKNGYFSTVFRLVTDCCLCLPATLWSAVIVARSFRLWPWNNSRPAGRVATNFNSGELYEKLLNCFDF